MMTTLHLVALLLLGCMISTSRGSGRAVRLPPTISIRGHSQLQTLPLTYAGSWKTWTCELTAKNDHDMLQAVEGPQSEGGWCNPTSFDTLFLPADLPLPMARMALGVVMANGSPRYLMPSMVLTLETPGQVWRNRGLNSLPRANAWIDMFAPFAISIDALKLASFGKFADEVRFLEDQDGSSAWLPLDSGPARTMLRPSDSALYDIAPTYDRFQQMILKSTSDEFAEIKCDYHFVDIPLLDVPPIRLPTSRRIRQFLTDFDEPRRLLEVEDPKGLDSEPLGEAQINVLAVAAGGESKFLPSCYKELYEEGNIIVS